MTAWTKTPPARRVGTTPSRKEAEAARKRAMKTPMTRKEQMKREREARAQIRERQQAALKSGDEKYLPLRDRGPGAQVHPRLHRPALR